MDHNSFCEDFPKRHPQENEAKQVLKCLIFTTKCVCVRGGICVCVNVYVCVHVCVSTACLKTVSLRWATTQPCHASQCD